MLLLCPRGLQQAQHGVQAVAAGVLNQRITLGMAELEAQSKPGLAQLQRVHQVLAGDETVGRLLGAVVAFVAAPLQHLTREQAGVGLQRHAAGVACVQAGQMHTRIQQLERQNSAPRTAAPATRRPSVAGSIEAPPAAAPDTDSAEQRYQQAQQQYRSGNYAAAINLLRHAESGGNGGDTARQSMYLLLQSHQRLANCESVINIGNRYANRFRSSAQAPEALYSVAQCQTRLQQRDIARDTWRRLIQIYPDSAAAKRAYRQMNPR